MTTPADELPLGTCRTTWATAAELQQAADRLRATGHVHKLGNPDDDGGVLDDWDNCRDPECPGPTPAIPQVDGALANPVADWLDETANALAWLAPFREHEPGHRMWQTATAVARAINGSAR